MPKLIDYPRTSYTGAWELAEITDDTGGKCTIETAARKLNRKVSGSFKAIIGSAVKFGLLTSKRELLSTTTLFKRIKHAYDKQEELLFHREAFLAPPLFTQLCRKFRSRELPVQMLDVMLIREFGVEEINAQGVAKAFVDGCRMVGLLNEHNIVADIDALARQQSPRRELANPQPIANTFRQEDTHVEGQGTKTSPTGRILAESENAEKEDLALAHNETANNETGRTTRPIIRTALPAGNQDAIASLFGLLETQTPIMGDNNPKEPAPITDSEEAVADVSPVAITPSATKASSDPFVLVASSNNTYQIQVSGPGVNTTLSITEEADVAIAIAVLEKIRRQLKG